jgi:hypothetical protein
MAYKIISLPSQISESQEQKTPVGSFRVVSLPEEQKEPGIIQSSLQAITETPRKVLRNVSAIVGGTAGLAGYGLNKLLGREEQAQQQLKSALEATSPLPQGGDYLGATTPLGYDELGKKKEGFDLAKDLVTRGIELGTYGFPATGASEQVISRFLPKMAKTVLPKAETVGARALQKFTTLPGLTRLAGRGVEFGTVAGTLTAGENIREGRPAGEGVVQSFLAAGALPFLGVGAQTALRPVEKVISKTSKFLRSFKTPTAKDIGEEVVQLKEAYDDVFSARESTNAKAEFIKEHGKDPSEVLSQSGIIPKLEYTNGKTIMRTKGEGGTVDRVSEMIAERGSQIQSTADNVQKTIGRNIPLAELEEKAIAEAQQKSSGLEINSLLSKIKSEFASLRTKYGENIGVGDINLERINSNRLSGAWDRPSYEQDAFSMIGNVFRNILDEKMGSDIVRRLNVEIGDLIAGRKMLLALDGKGIGGGRFTNIIASGAGAILTGIMSKDANVVTQVINTVVTSLGIKMFLRMLQSGKFGGATTKRILSHLAENRTLLNELIEKEPKILQEAYSKELMNLIKGERLKLPPAKEGLPQSQSFVPPSIVPPTTYEKGVLPYRESSQAKIKSATTKPMMSPIKRSIPYLSKERKPENFAGASAGIEYDEETGQYRFNPQKAAVGVLGVSALNRGVKKNVLPVKISKEVKSAPPQFKGFKDLTTKFLDYAKGKTTLSKQEIEEFARRPELKKGEADDLNILVRNLPEGKHSAEEIADALRFGSEKYGTRGALELKPVKVKDPQYRNVSMDRDAEIFNQEFDGHFGGRKAAGGTGKNYEEVVFESPITTNGSSHYPNSKNYFAHLRADEIIENGVKIRRVQEIQSDWLQKMTQAIKDELPPKVRAWVEAFGNDRYGERIMREDIKASAQKGYSKYRIPTGETIGKIEGFQSRGFKILGEEVKTGKYKSGDFIKNYIDGGKLTTENVRIGQHITEGSSYHYGGARYIRDDRGAGTWIITDVLGDGRFKAVQKKYQDLSGKNWKYEIDNSMVAEGGNPAWRAYNKLTGDNDFVSFIPSEKAKALEYLKSKHSSDFSLKELGERYGETFDLTGKSNPQYRRYQDWGKFLKNKYGGKEIFDSNGNSWVEVSLTKEQGRLPVEAFGIVPFMLQDDEK